LRLKWLKAPGRYARLHNIKKKSFAMWRNRNFTLQELHVVQNIHFLKRKANAHVT
jgi:hypothetical protein